MIWITGGWALPGEMARLAKNLTFGFKTDSGAQASVGDPEATLAEARQLVERINPESLAVEFGCEGVDEQVDRLVERLAADTDATARRMEYLARRGRLDRRGRRGRQATSFVKWAGSKVQVMDRIRQAIPRRFGTYYEPMVGSGTVWLKLNPKRAILGDVNAELINCFLVIRDHLEPMVRILGTHKNTAEHFAEVRAIDPNDLSPVERAARTIYLNKTCFNGLYRVNKSGRFNVPYGHIAWANTCDEHTLRKVHRRLQGVTVLQGDYEACVAGARRGDLVYFDPPYLSPGPKPTIFYAYQPRRFGEAEQRRLADLFRRLDRRSCHVVASNSDVPLVRELYRGFRVDVVATTRPMNCKTSRRKGWHEVLISNTDRGPA